MKFSATLLLALLAVVAQSAPSADPSITRRTNDYLAHLDVYKLKNPSLTPEQTQVLDDIAAYGRSGTRDPVSEDKLCIEAEKAFGSAEATYILFGKERTSDVKKRRFECDCADASANCSTGWDCQKGRDNCKKSNGGCGFGWAYDCDGMCVGK